MSNNTMAAISPQEKTDEVTTNVTTRYVEYEAFNSIVDALQWKHIRKRAPVCFRNSLHNRYMLANLVYLGYTIGLLIVDFDPAFIDSSSEILTTTIINETSNDTTTLSILDEPVYTDDYANRVYIGLAALNIVIASLYVWTWRGRSWFDVVLIPEYLNHIQAGLYLWSALLYSKQETLGGYYTMAVHRIELSASCVELFTSVGWMLTWYIAYTRTLGRGFTLDDLDTIAYITTTSNTLMYFIYNLQVYIRPEEYNSNMLFTYADILGFIGSVYYIFGTLRDDNWFWFLPVAGQYGVAVGRIEVVTKQLPKYGLPPIVITDMCKRRRKKNASSDSNTIPYCELTVF
ncbi:unnamed protein product [Adineta steineri]|uniref:Uncharacterized protein n=1 Tax=Adineta steineri TaxID=433720 RepID=A0A814RLI3_9BILA|nr:unnamed protein product [Adineta steineri]CAF1206262.1 unnamed protein product [Adineta steineri]CAF3957640.1 unnamed protein product [Adineta steineri]CAF3959302.1 unnamed protein product [Adineta steineri]